MFSVQRSRYLETSGDGLADSAFRPDVQHYPGSVVAVETDPRCRGQGMVREKRRHSRPVELLSVRWLTVIHRTAPQQGGLVLPNALTQPPSCMKLRDTDIYTSSAGNQPAQHRISWYLPAPGLCRL